jgi:branched-chain amino acid transport system substrate-binding protein
MKKTLIAVVVIILGVMLGLSFVKNKDTSNIKIGFIGPLSGDVAEIGIPVKNSVVLAIDEINAVGGVNGRKIELISEDGKCGGKDAVSAAQKLVNIDKVKYIIATCSGEVSAVLPVTDSAKVMVISPSASASNLSGASKYFFRNTPSDEITGVILADYVSKFYKTAAIFAEKAEFSQGLKNNFSSEAKIKGLTITKAEDFTSGTTDFRSGLTKIQSDNPDVIFISPLSPQGWVNIAKQARQLGIKSQFVGALFGANPEVAKEQSIQGTVFANLSGLSTDKGKEYIAKYLKTFGILPNYAFQDGAAYDNIYLISQAIKAVGDNAEDVSSYLSELEKYEGVIGTYSFDEKGNMVGAGIELQKIIDGESVNI